MVVSEMPVVVRSRKTGCCKPVSIESWSSKGRFTQFDCGARPSW
jgi:hypothetical protein